MPKRSSKHPKHPDVNVLASSIVQKAVGEDQVAAADEAAQSSSKNPFAVALGKLGGIKGGKARAEKLSSERRKEIALLAAKARWNKK